MKKLLLIAGVLFIYVQLNAQTWNGTTNTDWNTATNWTPNGVPATTGNVVIPGALTNYPVLASNTTVNSINMQSGSRLDVNGFAFSLLSITNYNYFIGATLNNSNVATDIVININTGGGGYVSYFRSNTVNDAIIFNLTGTNQFFEGDAAPSNQFNGTATFNINDVLPVYISYIAPSQYTANLIVSRTVAGSTSLFNGGGAITGNYTFTNNAGGATGMGNAGIKTTIAGTVNIASNYPSPTTFQMHRLINQTTGGSVNVQNTGGFDIQKDTLLVSSFSITGYRGSAYAYFLNNAITGTVTVADDASYTGGYITYIRNNTITGNSTFTNNGSNAMYEADASSSGNHYIGNVTFNGAGSGQLFISHIDASQFDGNLTINRTAAGPTQAFNGGGNINGNFNYTNNVTGPTYFGNVGIKTSITGIVTIAVNHTTPNVFQMHRLINQTTSGTINVQNTAGFDVQKDTILVSSFSITGYRGNAYGYFLNNAITGNVTTADDASYTGGYVTFIRNNVITGNTSFSNNGTNAFYDADGAGNGNKYFGNVTYNGAGGPLYIAQGDALQCTGNLTINRTAAGTTQAFNSGATITGNFAYTNNTAGTTTFGNVATKTSIGGMVNVTASYTAPNLFQIYRLVNQTTGGTINVQNTAGFDVQKDTLLVNSFSITGYRGSAYAYFLNNSITGNVTIADDASYGGGYNTQIRNNIITGNSTLTNNGTNIMYDADQASSGNKYIGNVTYARNGGSITVGTGDITEITKNLTLNSASGITLGQLKFNGTTDGMVEQLGTQDIIISQLTMAKTGSGKITLNDPVTVSGTLTFNSGKIFSSTTNNLVFSDNATSTGASDASYVDGPVTKIGNDAFIFPVGKAGKIASINISAPASVTDAFSAQYFNQPPQSAGYDTTMKDASLNHLSRTEYWLLDRTAGTSNVVVTLSWETSRSGPVNNMPDLRVARWSGSMWKDEGNGGTTGTNAAGTVKSLSAVSNFSPFTLASATLLNPLPVTLVKFGATKSGSVSKLLWITTNEVDIDHFEVEKSTNGNSFVNIQTIAAKGGNRENNYADVDNNPAKNKNYYRLKIIDINGTFSYSPVVLLDFSTKNLITLYPNPAATDITIYSVEVIRYVQVIDLLGRVVKTFQPSVNNTYSIKDLKSGTYFIKVISVDRTSITKLEKL